MGKEAFQERLDHGMNSFMFELKALEGQYDMEDPQGRTDFFKETAKRLLRFEDEIERSSYIKTIAGRTQKDGEPAGDEGRGNDRDCQTKIGSEQE